MAEVTPNPIDRLLRPEEVARILKFSTSWLAKARMAGEGPEFVKIGRAVRYPESCLRKRTPGRPRAKNDHPSQYINIHQKELGRTKIRNNYISIFWQYILDIFLI
jgi:predicted DNA-binding transcriptional regulator AlpA